MMMPISSQTTALYHEEQCFRQPWLWVLLLVLATCVAGIVVHGFYTQLYLNQPWGNRPMSDTALMISGSVSMVITFGLSLLFYRLKLITVVDNEGVHIRFFPLGVKHVRFEQIQSCTARTYRPIREYGGWGIRFGKKGMAYNVSGDRGVQLQLSHARPLLIGSQRADELASIINARL